MLLEEVPHGRGRGSRAVAGRPRIGSVIGDLPGVQRGDEARVHFGRQAPGRDGDEDRGEVAGDHGQAGRVSIDERHPFERAGLLIVEEGPSHLVGR